MDFLGGTDRQTETEREGDRDRDREADTQTDREGKRWENATRVGIFSKRCRNVAYRNEVCMRLQKQLLEQN